MTLQSSVAFSQAGGVVGEVVLDGPVRARSVILNSSDAALNVIGRAVTSTASNDNEVAIGGTQPFAGILGFPKEYATSGTTAGGTLAPTMTLPNNAQVAVIELATGVLVSLTNSTVNIGDDVCFVQATGALFSVAPGGAAGAGNTKIAGAKVVRNNLTSAGLAIISLTGLI